jgi:hypothetical protein
MKVIREGNVEEEFKTILEVGEEDASVFRHFKGHEYKILTFAKDCEDLSDLIIYQATYGDKTCWVRKLDEFFSYVDKDKYKDVEQLYRFEKIK